MAQLFQTTDVPVEAQPFTYVMRLATLGWAVRSVQALAEVGVFDALADEPSDARELALRCGCSADALERVMRLVASVGILARDADGRYAHTAASSCLRLDHPLSAAAGARLQGSPLYMAGLAGLEHTLRTGRPGTEAFAPDGAFAYLAQHPAEARTFDAAMTGLARARTAALAASYDFSRFRTIADIGGGQGQVLSRVLEKTPAAAGVLFDLPAAVAGASRADRMTVQPGDFFRDPLPTCDAYILMFVLHDWSDDRALEILRAVRVAARPGATLLIIETLMPDTPEYHVSKTLDVSMMAVFGGRERTALEFVRLLDATGFSAPRTLPTPAPLMAVLEAIAI